MRKPWRKKFCLALFSGVLALGVTLSFLLSSVGERVVLGPALLQGQTLVIDAGHGGEDGGAVSSAGACESQINLDIALRLDALCGFYGIGTVLTRSDDRSIHDSGADSLREKKTSDLHNRAQLVEDTPNAVLISIHQNSYTDSRYWGAQVFFSNAQLSEQWAVLTQETLRQTLSQENSRLAKVIPDSVYLMNHISCPALLVECGFLSNPEEAARLESPGYQKKIAGALLSAYLQHYHL